MAGSNCALGHGFRISDTPFPIESLPIDETPSDLSQKTPTVTPSVRGEDLLASFSRSYGIRTYVTRIAGVCPPERRHQMASQAKPASAWNPWLYCWVGSEDVADAHRLLMEAAARTCPYTTLTSSTPTTPPRLNQQRSLWNDSTLRLPI